MCAENPEIVRGRAGRQNDQQVKRDNCERRPHLLKMKHPRLDFASFNTMLAGC
jgi:hypothetical protein